MKNTPDFSYTRAKCVTILPVFDSIDLTFTPYMVYTSAMNTVPHSGPMIGAKSLILVHSLVLPNNRRKDCQMIRGRSKGCIEACLVLHVLLLYRSLSSNLTNAIKNLGDGLWLVNRKLFLPTYPACGISNSSRATNNSNGKSRDKFE